MTPLAYLDHYLQLGWVVVPTQRGNSRAPVGDDWQKRTAPVADPRKYRTGAFLVCGRASGVSVIDLDGTRWFDRFNELLEQYPTPIAHTPSGGAHILVRYSEAPWWNNRVKLAPEIDLRTEGGGIALPMVDEGRYWFPESAPWEVPLADPEPYERLLLELIDECRDEMTRPGASAIPDQGRSALASLLAHPPMEGERNDWLARVAGHLAPGIDHEDGWLALVRFINGALPDPLPNREVYSTVAKMWQADRAKRQTDAIVSGNHPWSVQTGVLFYQKDKTPRAWLEPAPEVIERRRDAHGDPSWKIANGGLVTTITAADLHNSQRLSVALSRIDVLAHSQATPTGENGNELARWLNAQGAPHIIEYPWWGWNDGVGWVGLDDDMSGPDSFKPLIGWVDRPDIIEQLPTWQDPEIAAVFCAWVALQAAKGRITTVIEPNIVLRGASGAGKTRGLFSFGSRLTGSRRSAISTTPTLRDHLASHRNGIVVIDDKSDLDASTGALELYRLSTSSEAQQLKRQTAGGWVDQRIPLVGSLLISGEALIALATDRALRDRSIILEVKPASDRRSVIDPSRPQWDDIQAVFADLGGIDESVAHELAGPFIRRILAAVDQVGEPVSTSGDRVSVKLGLLHKGAELWQAAYPGSRCSDGRTVVEAVDSWISKQANSSDWRSLTLINRVLPDLVADFGSHWQIMKIDEEGRMVVHLPRLSQEWLRTRHQARDREIGSVDNLRREMEALAEAELATYGRILTMGIGRVRVWTLERPVVQRLEAISGVALGDDTTLQGGLFHDEA